MSRGSELGASTPAARSVSTYPMRSPVTALTSSACAAAAATEAGSVTSSATRTASGCVTLRGSRAVA